MPRRVILRVYKAKYARTCPWMVRVPDRLQQAEGAKRRFFKKESEAKAYLDRLIKDLCNYHTLALGLTDIQKLEASECFRLMTGREFRLVDAVRFYIAHLEQTEQSVSIQKLFAEFLKAKRQDGISYKYETDLKSKTGRFVREFSEVMLCDLTPMRVEAWLRGMNIQAVSRESYRRNIAVMFEFGRKRGWSKNNPAADIKMNRKLEGEVSILTPDEVINLLEHCCSGIIPYVAICAFAGLRPSEAEALRWENVHLDGLQIEVKAKHSKTRRYRLVPIQPNLAEWLRQYRGPAADTDSIGYSRTLFREAYKAAGIEKWKLDVLRHSYGTYRLPILKSADALALEMGNSPDIIFRHYRRPMSEAVAKQYFDIVPATLNEGPSLKKADSNPENQMLPNVVVETALGNAPGTIQPDSGHGT